MVEPNDFELNRTSDEPPFEPPPSRPSALWLVIAALVVATAAAFYLVMNRNRAAPATTGPGAAPPQAAIVRPLGGAGANINVPPLDESDPVVRELVKQITTHPRIAAWLATDGLIRTFTVAVENVAGGPTPSGHLRVWRPAAAFETAGRGPDLHTAPRSYERYDGLADAAASIDAAGAARLYATLKPRIEEAHRDLGSADSFDRTLEQAIVSLLRTPVPTGGERLEAKGIGFVYLDPALEGLTGAQKHLLRTGPRNVRMIQASLRQIALALGIPAERLPAAPR